MRKIICIFIVAGILLSVFTACGNSESSSAAAPTTTLMIYMVGSDLEAKTGSATMDLQELVESGIDFTQNNVVVCAGGSPHWHNDQVDKERINILTVNDLGYTSIGTTDGASMGTAEELAFFLDYCWQSYPTDEYALILWDHGNGPVMGYGKDMLFDNDALLLKEMGEGLQASPFSAENKLSWVGFDACLMASAELSCLLADYADYLVASQEIEPAFGWNYAALSQLGKVDTPTLLKSIASEYMLACAAYYEKRGYEHYDVTLSVTDLSCADELESAINALFAAASEEVSHYYDLLATNRAQSRALGKATTGSDYDLVDLQSMTENLAAQYPAQAQALLDVISRMIIANETSMDGCCGMSLYYPFFNKQYYEREWKSIYSELGIFPQYQTYLANYEKTWLREDMLDIQASMITPEKTAERTYSITLSKEQAKSYSSATYHILRRESGDLYREVYSSRDVIWQDGTLSAVYDGMAIYIRSGDEKFIPPLGAIDQIGDLFRYSGIFQLSNMTYQPADVADEDLPEDILSNWRYLLTMNKKTGTIEISGTLPLEDTTTEDLIINGRAAEADLSLYGGIHFVESSARYITRYDNGAIMPLRKWYTHGSTQAYALPLSWGYSFEYAPIAGGEYYLMFEITDTQSVTYCTELLPITVEDVKEEEIPLDVTTSVWKSGEDRVLLKELDDVRIYLITRDTEYGGTRYFVEAENFRDNTIKINLSYTIANGTLLTENSNSFKVYPYDFMYDDLSFGVCEDIGALATLSELQFVVKITDERTGEIVLPRELLRVDMRNAPTFDRSTTYAGLLDRQLPHLGALADKQVLYESDELRLTLMGLADTQSEDSWLQKGSMLILAENLCDHSLNININGFVVNGWFISSYTACELTAGIKTYLSVRLTGSDLEALGIKQINSLSILAAASENRLWWTNKTECLWCPVTLTQSGEPQEFVPGELLWEEQNVRVYAHKQDRLSGKWQLVIENNSEHDICLEIMDAELDGIPEIRSALILADGKVGAGQRTICNLGLYLDDAPLPEEISFRFQVRSFDEIKVLFVAKQTVTLRRQ